MKKYAIFLPQFHEIPENNKWWGKGFTEWTNVKKGKSLFKGHIQPKTPLNNDYYNLLKKETMINQTNLMNSYHIDGMAYYHYYFKGKKLLEKPAENLLKWTDIPQNFFFIWANHSWIKTWEGKKDVLIKQEYGNKEDWENHFQYLIKFFKDDRYEKKDNMPIMGVFNPFIPNKNEMFEYFDLRCKDEGFSGIYIFESYGSASIRSFPQTFNRFLERTSEITKAVAIRQPAFCEYDTISGIKKIIYVYYRNWMRSAKRKSQRILVLNGNKMVEKYIKMKFPKCEKDIIPGVFFEWDNTARHKSRGYVITPLDKKHFFNLMDHVRESEYILINAWNEWCEGMILEPTEENGYRYLEWIKEWTENNNN